MENLQKIKIKKIKKIGKKQTIDFNLSPHEIYKVNNTISHNCHNHKFQDYNYGVEREIPELIEYIKDRIQWIDGITLSGGDPLFQPDLRLFLETIRADPDLKKINIWMWTGFLFEEVPNYIKSKINVIIDGKYNKELAGVMWRGSSNQRIWKHVVGHHFEQIPEDEIKDFSRMQNLEALNKL